MAEGRGIYYSRSRGGLWRKGDSSGAVQELVALDFDCDSDALRFIVRQRGDPPVRDMRALRCVALRCPYFSLTPFPPCGRSIQSARLSVT